MPNNSISFATGLDSESLEQLSSWVLNTYPDSRVLCSDELSEYTKSNKPHPVMGWLVSIMCKEIIYDLHVLISKSFPWERPVIYCRDKFKFHQFPHIDPDGAFCLYSNTIEHNPLDSQGLINHAIKMACEFISESCNPEFANHFIDEFASYWHKSTEGKTIFSLLTPSGNSRCISLYKEKETYYFADDEKALANWFSNFSLDNKKKYKTEAAAHIVLERPIKPDEYPKSGKDIWGIINNLSPNSLDIIYKIIKMKKGNFLLSFEGKTENGPVFFAVDLLLPEPKTLKKGFRQNKELPLNILQMHLKGANSNVVRHNVQRADASWIHSRDIDKACHLFSKRVLVIGCGSLGSEVAQMLAKSGVGSISLIDPEIFDFANVGRHTLGVYAFSDNKAEALEKKLKRDYPHMLSVESFAKDCHQVYKDKPEIFHKADLIISAVGSWRVEGRLNKLALDNPDIAPILYGWAEKYSVAGHAVLIDSKKDCFSCGLDIYGKTIPENKICEWNENKVTTRNEPQCGVSYQPYGPADISAVVTLVTKSAIKALIGKFKSGDHAMHWVSMAEIKDAEGKFAENFLDAFNEKPVYGGTKVKKWSKSGKCAFCNKNGYNIFNQKQQSATRSFGFCLKSFQKMASDKARNVRSRWAAIWHSLWK